MQVILYFFYRKSLNLGSIIILIFISIVFITCVRLYEKLTIKYSNTITTPKLKLNGYYFHLRGIPEPIYDSITNKIIGHQRLNNITPLVFYNNGLVYFKRRGFKENHIFNDSNYFNSLPHTSMINNWTTELNSGKIRRKNLIGWGLYVVKKDSIYIEYYDRAYEDI